MKKEKFIKKFGEYINQALYEKTSVRFDFYYNIDNGINISFHKTTCISREKKIKGKVVATLPLLQLERIINFFSRHSVVFFRN